MDEFDIFFENTSNALEVIGSLPSSYFHRFSPDAFIMATGAPSADENWAWVKSGYSRELLIEVIEKFEERSLQFIWPVFPNPDVQMELDMDELGLLARGTLTPMIFDSSLDSYANKPAGLKLSARRVSAPEDILVWADTCWGGFTENEEAPPPEFVRFARNAALNDKLGLILGYIGGKPAGTYMLCKCGGIYISHFTVLRKWRNLGAGSFLMNDLMSYNDSVKNRYLALIATKQGERLYKRFGFRKIAGIPVRSFSDEI